MIPQLEQALQSAMEILQVFKPPRILLSYDTDTGLFEVWNLSDFESLSDFFVRDTRVPVCYIPNTFDLSSVSDTDYEFFIKNLIGWVQRQIPPASSVSINAFLPDHISKEDK